MRTPRKTQIIPKREIVPLNKQIAPQVVYVRTDLLLFGRLLQKTCILALKVEQPDSLDLVDGYVLNLTNEFTALDVEQKMVLKDRQDSYQPRTTDLHFIVWGQVLLELQLGYVVAFAFNFYLGSDASGLS